jgi:hypothetical protein
MTSKTSLGPIWRDFFRNNLYVCDGRLFFRSRRAFRLLAVPRGVIPAPGLPPHEQVTVAVTPGWWLLSFLAPPRGPHVLVARFPFGRFGNQTFQLAHILTIAREMSISRTLLPGNTVTPPGVWKLGDYVTWDNREETVAQVTWAKAISALFGIFSFQAHIVGTFFHTTVFPKKMVNPELRAATFAALREAIPQQSQKPVLSNKHLVIHIRGDDVFNDFPPKAFAQPPFAFYEKVLDDDNWEYVTVVSGDDVSPILAPLFAELNRRGLAHRFQSGTLHEDMAVLRSASTVVAGRGTFLPALTSLSPATERVYCFEEDHLFRKDLNIRVVVDRTGRYVESTYRNNWRNTNEQRNLMLHYSKENLTIR